MKKTIPIAEFKSHCHKIIEEAQIAQKEITLSKNGKPIATITPIMTKKAKPSMVGLLAGKAEIKGDIISTDAIWDAEND
jgi:prevent-host-death family protein